MFAKQLIFTYLRVWVSLQIVSIVNREMHSIQEHWSIVALNCAHKYSQTWQLTS